MSTTFLTGVAARARGDKWRDGKAAADDSGRSTQGLRRLSTTKDDERCCGRFGLGVSGARRDVRSRSRSERKRGWGRSDRPLGRCVSTATGGQSRVSTVGSSVTAAADLLAPSAWLGRATGLRLLRGLSSWFLSFLSWAGSVQEFWAVHVGR